MSAISYVISPGKSLEQITTGTNAPSSGTLELRIDTTTTSITEGAGTRAQKRGEVQAMIRILEQYLLKDTNIPQ